MRYFIFTILLVLPLLLTAQSKKEQIATLNYKKDSLNLVIQNDRQNCNQNMDSLKTMHIVDKEKLQTKIQFIKDSLNILKNEIYMVSEEIAVLSDSIMLQKNIIFEYEKMAPKGLFYYEIEYGNYELFVQKITDGNNQKGKDVTIEYCDCMNNIIQFMKNNEDYHDGSYWIDGASEMTEDELNRARAWENLLYYDIDGCSLFPDPDTFEVFFSPEARALNESSNIYFNIKSEGEWVKAGM